MNKCVERIYNGLIKENPTFVLTLGMCPTLAVTTSAINGIGMGLSSTVVLVMSNLLISLLRKVIPYACVYCYCCFIRYSGTVPYAGLSAITLRFTRNLYSSYCCKLHYSWTCRSICFKESGYTVCI